MKVKIAEFRARNIKSSHMTYIEVEKVGNIYYFLTAKGERGNKYTNLGALIHDIKYMYGDWCDFKILVKRGEEY